jgi:hypothetical protein
MRLTSTLAFIWKLAVPYFCFEDCWAGRLAEFVIL